MFPGLLAAAVPPVHTWRHLLSLTALFASASAAGGWQGQPGMPAQAGSLQLAAVGRPRDDFASAAAAGTSAGRDAHHGYAQCSVQCHSTVPGGGGTRGAVFSFQVGPSHPVQARPTSSPYSIDPVLLFIVASCLCGGTHWYYKKKESTCTETLACAAAVADSTTVLP